MIFPQAVISEVSVSALRHRCASSIIVSIVVIEEILDALDILWSDDITTPIYNETAVHIERLQ